MTQNNQMNPPTIVAVTTDHLFILPGFAISMQEFEKWAKGMQQITAAGQGQMTVDMAVETYMSHACLILFWILRDAFISGASARACAFS